MTQISFRDFTKVDRSKFNLLEMFNTKGDIVWKDSPSGQFGYFELDGNGYCIELNEFESELSFGKILILEINFKVRKSDKFVYDLERSRKNKSKLFGIILNGVKDKLVELNPDAVFFASIKERDGYSERLSLYHMIHHWGGHLFSKPIWQHDFENSKGTFFITFLKRFAEEEKIEIDNHIELMRNK